MDIREAMMALQAQRGLGNPGVGAGQPINPLGALQPGMRPDINMGMNAGMGGAGGPLPPDFNAILQQRMVDMNAQRQAMQAQMMQQMADRFGARTDGAVQFDPSMGMAGMRDQFQDWRQAQQPQRPMGFGGGNPGMRPAQPAQQPTQPANVAVPPGGGVQSALGQGWGKKPRLGGAGGGFNQDTNVF